MLDILGVHRVLGCAETLEVGDGLIDLIAQRERGGGALRALLQALGEIEAVEGIDHLAEGFVGVIGLDLPVGTGQGGVDLVVGEDGLRRLGLPVRRSGPLVGTAPIRILRLLAAREGVGGGADRTTRMRRA